MLFKRSILCIIISTALQSPSFAEDGAVQNTSDESEIEFNDQFLFNTGAKIDVSRFAKGNPIVPGTFKTQIAINGQKKLLTEFTFKDNGTTRATPCFTAKLLLQLGIKQEALKDIEENSKSCLDIVKILSGASWDFISG